MIQTALPQWPNRNDDDLLNDISRLATDLNTRLAEANEKNLKLTITITQLQPPVSFLGQQNQINQNVLGQNYAPKSNKTLNITFTRSLT